MAVYTRVGRQELTSFLARYGLPPATSFKGIAEGVENTNYLVVTAGRNYILTLYEKRVAEEDLPYFLALMDHVVTSGVPAAAPISVPHGGFLQTLCDRPAALIEFLEGTWPTDPTPAEIHAAGKALAKLHTATATFERVRQNSLGPTGWQELAGRLGSVLDRWGEGLCSQVQEDLSHLRGAWSTELPMGTIHADYFPDNVLFVDGAVSGIIDFYFACTDFYAYDLAVSMNAWTPEGSTDATAAKIFLEGYSQVRTLSEAEQAALPLLLQGAAMRFFLTRAHDMAHQVEGSLVTVKDPVPYLHLYRFHRDGSWDL